MTRKQREASVVDVVPDQAATLTRMIAADHEAGRHGLPLAKCEACRADPEYFARRKAAEAPIEPVAVIGSVRIIRAKDTPEYIVPTPANPTNVRPRRSLAQVVDKAEPGDVVLVPVSGTPTIIKPRRSTKPAVPPVVEQPKHSWPSPGARNPALFTKKQELVTVIPGTVTREAWLLAGVEKMRPWLAEHDIIVPEVRISTGWPGGRGPKEGVRGQCWMASEVADGKPAIFVSPDQDDVPTILGIVLHEMIHAAGGFGHKGVFAKAAKLVGFIPPFTSSEFKTDALKDRIQKLAAEMPPLDHSPIRSQAKPGTLLGKLLGVPVRQPRVQSTRMILLRCPVDGYSVRTTRKWIEVGLPYCPAAVDMHDADDRHQMEEVTK